MSFSKNRVALAAAAAVLAAAACSGNSTVPPAQSMQTNVAPQFTRSDSSIAKPDDSRSILNKLTKDVVIGSTVDPTNGDTGPHSISVAPVSYGLTKGQLAVCNFADKTGAAGKGTTIEVFDPKPDATPTPFVQSSDIEVCDGAAVTNSNEVWASGLTSGLDAGFLDNGKLKKTLGAPLVAPLSDVYAACPPNTPSCLYNAEYIFTGDAQTGGVVILGVGRYGLHKPLQVVEGFAVNKKAGWSALGPSGLSYNYPADTLYIADGVTDTVVGIYHASALLVKNEIIVKPGGKTFKCKYHQSNAPCGKLIYAGAPLEAPDAMTTLPNGNLIVANTKHNSLVEIDVSDGKVLASKLIDKSKTAHIFGLASSGTKDRNTVLYYTDTADNTLHALEQ
ncbi:MAG: hypothetical protein JO113_03060 [Candidatus Eremiobacteraeota bacterium]|nr:hypothetical protein [Candidatus Eremiobacteraeota bacterium]